MAGEWHTLRLGKVCKKIGSGATPRGGSNVYLEEGEVALIRSQNVHNDGFRRDGLVYLTAEHAAELSNVEVQRDDVLLNITGDSVARSCQVAPDVLPARVNQHVAIIRPDPKVLWPCFLRYFLVSPQTQAEMLGLAGVGATRNALTKGMIESFEIAAPVDVDEQRAIAHILGTLDEKIELNHRLNETLEADARAIFRSWFVDFDPVRAKASGVPPDAICRRFGLTADHLAIFPGRLVDSELGKIPDGWDVRTVGDVADVVKGKSYKSAELAPSTTALVTLKSFNRGGGYRLDGLKEYTGSYKSEQEVVGGDLIVAYTDVTQEAEVIGKPALVISDNRYGHLVISLDVAAIRPARKEYRVFLYGLMSGEGFQAHTRAHTTGTTVLHLAANAVPNFRFACPPDPLVDLYADIVVPIFQSIDKRVAESRTLAALRDTLVPKLLSGEIRVTPERTV
jgi:type I restriction enzyme S subunit